MYTILLVEDEPGMRTIICDYFAAQTDAPAVVCAEDGHAALALVAAQDFDLALLDIMLPEADGFAVCRAIRRKSDMPVIFLTARRAEEDKLQGYGLGADDYMEKPFTPARALRQGPSAPAPCQRVCPRRSPARPRRDA